MTIAVDSLSTLVCLSLFMGAIMKMSEELYKWTSPTYIKKSTLLKEINERLVFEVDVYEKAKGNFVSSHDEQIIIDRINLLCYYRDFIRTL